MAIPVRLDLEARRNTPFSKEWPFTEETTGDPFDFTDATVAMQVRMYGAQAGAALIDLVEVGTAQTEGLIVDAGSILCWIDQTSLLFLPTGKPGADVVFQYDLVVQLPDEVAEVWAYGTFTVTPGVTDRLIILTNESNVPLTGDGAYLIGA